ncbi:hypothetical protein [Flavobacterium sp. JP2137]|uniref:hypothetical protein n=1 Tax=Flavobacterium sp. JP2137 TaxID=3414510 RepID=UPI003D2FDB21
MKKITLLIAAVFLTLTACSKSDDDSSSSYVQLKIDGVSKKYRKVKVTKKEDEFTAIQKISNYEVIATEGDNVLNNISFWITISLTENNHYADRFEIENEGIKYYAPYKNREGTFNAEILESNDKHATGVFAGELKRQSSENKDEVIKVEAGEFNIIF